MSIERKPEQDELERILRADRERLDAGLSTMSDEKLNRAIALGAEEGRRRRIQFKRSRWSLGMGVSVVCIFLLLTAFVRVSPSFAEALKEIPGLSGFVELIARDSSLINAIENKYIQPVNKSAAGERHKLTVEGIIADEGRMVIFYSGEGPGVWGEEDLHHIKLDGEGKEIQAGIGYSSFPTGEVEKATGRAVATYINVIFADAIKVPEQVRLQVNMQDEWLEVAFPVEHERFVGMREEIVLNETLSVSDQRFTLENVVISPLQVRVKIVSDPANPLRTNSLLNLALVDEKGHLYRWTGGMGELDNVMTFHFQSSYFEKPKQLKLVADGVRLSERNETLVVNTETGETIYTPNDKLELERVFTRGDKLMLSVIADGLDEYEENNGYSIIDYLESFTDATGASFEISSGGGAQIQTTSNNREGALMRNYYEIPDQPYVQPLTFKLREYPGYELKPIEIVIK
jgi:hypothetical protein